jgi:acetylornithine/succinyldiaminopimelate/putrescine aminotransferase
LRRAAPEKSRLFRSLLSHPLISEIRGEGLLLAVKLAKAEHIPWIISHAPGYGIILDYFLFCNDSFRIAPPLTISHEETEYACSQIKLLLDDTMKNV